MQKEIEIENKNLTRFKWKNACNSIASPCDGVMPTTDRYFLSWHFHFKMDKYGGGIGNVIELKQRVANMRKQCYESNLLFKNFHIQYKFSLFVHLNEHAQFKRKFGLYAIDLAFSSDFQRTKMEQTIEKCSLCK